MYLKFILLQCSLYSTGKLLDFIVFMLKHNGLSQLIIYKFIYILKFCLSTSIGSVRLT